MKWIKYQIVCGKNENEEDILILKKVGYNEANLAIAEKEAHNGEYEIVEDTESYDKEPLEVELGGTGAKIPKNARKNLGISGEKLIDSKVASMKVVPEGSGEYAAVNKVGGMSYKSRNLLEIPKEAGFTTTKNGVVYTVQPDKSISVSGTPTDTTTWKNLDFSGYKFSLPIGNYKFACKGLINSSKLHPILYYINSENKGQTLVSYSGRGVESIPFTITNENKDNIYLVIGCSPDYTPQKERLYISIFKEAETNTSYEPYYSGIRNAAVHKIISNSNLIDEKTLVNTSGSNYTEFKNGQLHIVNATGTTYASNTISITVPKGTWYLKMKTHSYTTQSLPVGMVIINGTPTYINGVVSNTVSYTFDTPTAIQVRLTTHNQTQIGEAYCNLWLTPVINGEYKPYNAKVLEIPTNVIATTGYGLGINENYYNYIDWERKVFVKRCIKVSGFTKAHSHSTVSAWHTPCPTEVNLTAEFGLCSVNVPYHGSDADMPHWYTGSGSIWIYAPIGEDMSNEEIIVPLTVPEEIDISTYLQNDNFIEVMAEGMVLAVSQYNYDAPTEIEFYIGDSNKDIVVADTFVGNLIGTANNAKVAENLSNLIEDLENPGCYYRIVNGVQEWINPPMIKDTEYQTTERWLGSPVYTKVVAYWNAVSYIGANVKKNITIQTDTPNFEMLIRYSGLIKLAKSTVPTATVKVMPIPGFTFDEEGTIDDGTGNIGVKYMSNNEVVLACNGPQVPVGASFIVQVWYTKSEVSTTEVEETETTEVE